MSRRARNRAATAAIVVLIAGIILGTGTLSGTFASFTAEAGQKTSTVSGGWVAAPTSLGTPSVAGNGANLAWTHQTTGVTGQEIWFADVGSTSASCTGPTYGGLVTGGSLSPTANSIGASGTPNDAVPAANQGDFICYQVRSTHNAWYSPSTFPTAVQVGLVPTGTITNSDSTSRLESGDVLTIPFNHPPSYSGGNISVSIASGSITLSGIGTLTGSFTSNKSIACTNSPVGVSGSSITITLGSCPNGNNGRATMSGSATYTGTGTTVSASFGSPAATAYQCTIAAACLTASITF